MLVDTHAHLSFPQFAEDQDDAIERAAHAGVTQIVDVGTNLEISRRSVALAERQRSVYATVGVHPHDVEGVHPEDLADLSGLMGHGRVVGVGETGLDFFRDYAPHDVQESVFRWHIQRALEYDLPLVVHSRGAEDRVLAILAEEAPDGLTGVLHCFGGSLEQARGGVEIGLDIGFGGTITFKKSTSLAVAEGLPRDRMLLETDCPYLAPVPHRGQRNEPAFVRNTAAFFSAHTGQVLSELAQQTTQNACRLFGLGVD